MDPLSLVFGLGGQNTMIGAVQLDALLREETRLNAEVTSYAVEDGTEISDHITQIPEELALSGVVTGASTMAFGLRGRSKLILNKDLLRMMHKTRMPLIIITGIDVYTDFAMTSVHISRRNDGDSFRVEARFKKIIKAQLSTAEVPQDGVSSTADAGRTQQRAGPTAAKAGSVDAKSAAGAAGGGVAPTEAQRKSWAASATDAIGGLF